MTELLDHMKVQVQIQTKCMMEAKPLPKVGRNALCVRVSFLFKLIGRG